MAIRKIQGNPPTHTGDKPINVIFRQNPEIEPPIINRPLYNMSAYVGQATVISCEAESDVEMGVSICKYF